MERDERIEALESELRDARRERRQMGQELQRVTERLEQVEAREQQRATPRLTGSPALLLGLVLVLTGLCARRAWAAAVTPNASVVTLHSPAGGLSPALTIPASDQAVIVSATTITHGGQGTGFVHITYHPVDKSLTWVGIHARSTVVATGGDVNPGVEIIDVAFGGKAELVTGPQSNQVQVKNKDSGPMDHRLTLIW